MRTIGHVHRRVFAFDRHFGASFGGDAGDRDFVFSGGVFEALDHVLGLGGKFVLVAGTSFTSEIDVVSNDVCGLAAFDNADVRGRLFVNAPQFHRGKGFGGDLDRRDPVFRRYARVRFQSVNLDDEVVR